MQEFVLRGKRDPEVQKIVDKMNYYWRQGIEEMVLEGTADGTFRSDISAQELVAMLMSIFAGTAAVSGDQIDAIERNTEGWILSDKVKKRLKKGTGAKR